jgi:hypothetical protein
VITSAKGIGLLSGGLDSILAVKVLQEQALELTGVTFTTPFFGPEPGLAAGRQAGIAVRVIDIGSAHLEMIKNPRYGFGRHMNPCIDCHALMLRCAGDMLRAQGADFLFTGEVLGQRPMSQRRDALRSVEKLAGLEGLILRPLSAKLLPPTQVEIDGRVERAKLLDIHGRSRRRQIALAEFYGIRHYPNPGGGCVLTKEGFVKKLRELLERQPDASLREVELLRHGRHFRLPGGGKLIVGRNEADNAAIVALAAPDDTLLRTRGVAGPVGLLPMAAGAGDVRVAREIVASYSDAAVSERVQVEKCGDAGTDAFPVNKADPGSFRDLMV